MKKPLKQKLEIYLKKVCKHELLRELTLQYFDDLSAHYAGRTFKREDFDTLTINGKVIEQDIVKDLLSTKTELTAQEVFLYLFKANVKHLSFFDKVFYSPLAGSFSPVAKIITVLQHEDSSLDDFVHTPLIRPEGITDKEWKKQRKQLLKDEDTRLMQALEKAHQKARDEEPIKQDLYHELSHVFETCTFKRRKHIKIGLEKLSVIKSKKNAFKEIMSEGETAFAETLNELFSHNLLNLQILNEIYYPVEKSGFVIKSKLQTDSGYNVNYDLAKLFALVLGNTRLDEVRFNSSLALKKLSRLNLTAKELTQIINDFKYYILDNSLVEEDSANTFITNLQTCNTAQIFNFMLGYATNSENGNRFNIVKTFIQTMLIKHIAYQISIALQNPKIAKDKKFFISLNNTLTSIDSALLYPNRLLTYKVPNPSNPISPLTQEVEEIECYSIEDYSQAYPKLSNLTSFNQLITTVKQYLALHPELEVELPFLQQQAEIQAKLKTLQQQHEQALLSEKQAIKQRLKAKQRQQKQQQKQKQNNTNKNKKEEKKMQNRDKQKVILTEGVVCQ